MNEDKLLQLMPKEVVKEDELNEKLEEQRKLIKKGMDFVSKLSINRFLKENEMEKITYYDIDERLNLFETLSLNDITINENMITKNEVELDIEYFDSILYHDLGLEDMYELDNLYIENLLKGKDITKKVVDIHGNKVSIAKVLERFVFDTQGLPSYDAPKLTQMLKAKRFLLGSYLAERNIGTILNGDYEIYNISILMDDTDLKTV